MAQGSSSRPRFTIDHGAETEETLVAGFAEFGLAGLTAVDYLTDQWEMTETGHLSADGLPAITPFQNGTPRHHTRLYSDGGEFTVLVGELAVPPVAGEALAESILSWAAEKGIEEVTLLSGVPVPHGPDEHVPFYVATEDYQRHRLTGDPVRPMGSGFLDGVTAQLVQQGIDTDLRVGLLTTPVHAQAPDADAALRLVEALTTVYDLDIDTSPLAEFATEVDEHYRALADRIEEAREDAPEDRMYM
ncbi:MAG: proteasome assembly chaperone family protein [Haloarculaceae archaeon]